MSAHVKNALETLVYSVHHLQWQVLANNLWLIYSNWNLAKREIKMNVKKKSILNCVCVCVFVSFCRCHFLKSANNVTHRSQNSSGMWIFCFRFFSSKEKKTEKDAAYFIHFSKLSTFFICFSGSKQQQQQKKVIVR